MATKTKTVGKTTNTIKKGETVTVQQACYAIANKINDRIINTNKLYKTSLEKVTAEQVLQDFSKNTDTAKILIIIAKYLDKKYQDAWQEYKLYKEYGGENRNIMELTDEERDYINKKRAKYQAKESQDRADKNTHKAISKALTQEEYKDIRYSTRIKYTAERIITNKDRDEIVFIDGLSVTDEELLNEYKDCTLKYYKSYHITQYGKKQTHHMFTFAVSK